MASLTPSHSEIEQLIRKSDQARSHLSHEVQALRRRLDVPTRVRGSLQKHPSAWLLGSMVSGMVASLLFRRGKKTPKQPPPSKLQTVKKRGKFASILALGFALSKPLITGMIRTSIMRKLFATTPQNHPFIR